MPAQSHFAEHLSHYLEHYASTWVLRSAKEETKLDRQEDEGEKLKEYRAAHLGQDPPQNKRQNPEETRDMRLRLAGMKNYATGLNSRIGQLRKVGNIRREASKRAYLQDPVVWKVRQVGREKKKLIL